MTVGIHVVQVWPNRAGPTGASVDLSCLIDEVSIQHGRSDTASQPEPSSCTVMLTVGPGAPLPAEVDIGAWLTVTTTPTGGPVSTRFVGRITDLGVSWDDAGPDTPEAGVGEIVAISQLADFGRRVIGDVPFPQELDGARIARVFQLAGYTLDPAHSDPGTVQVIPRDVDARAALEVAQDTAESAGGLIWETRAGEIRYADAEHRRGTDVAIDLDACDILVSPVWIRNLAGLVNQVSIGYGVETPDPVEPAPETHAEAPVYTASNPESIATWGRYAYSVTTELAEFWDVFSMSNLILAQNSYPVWMLEALPLDVPGLDAGQYATVLTLDVHSLLRVTGLPATGPTPTSLVAWVEGWTERLAWDVHEIELTVSDYCRTAPGERWDDVAPTVTWDTAQGLWDECHGPVADLGRWDDVAATARWDQVPADVEWDEAGVSP